MTNESKKIVVEDFIFHKDYVKGISRGFNAFCGAIVRYGVWGELPKFAGRQSDNSTKKALFETIKQRIDREKQNYKRNSRNIQKRWQFNEDVANDGNLQNEQGVMKL